MIKHLVLDMGGVIIRYDPRFFLRRAGLTNDEDIELLVSRVFFSRDWFKVDAGEYTEKELAEIVVPTLPAHLQELAARMIFSWNKPIVPMPGMAELIRDMSARGLHIHLLSNASARVNDYFTDIPGHEYFENIFISAEWKMVKPYPETFAFFCEHFGLKPAECLFVDDVPANCEGARKAGLSAFNFLGDVAPLRACIEELLAE